MATLTIDTSQIAGLAAQFERAQREAPVAIVRAVKRTGDSAAARMVPALTAQTGLKAGVIKRALMKRPAGMTYVIKSSGGNVSLKYFGARETRKGVSAAPWNARRVFGGTFIKGGRFPKRVGLGLGGHVYRRVGKGRMPITIQKSGLYIPQEMVKGASAAAFMNAVRTVLPARLAHELARILGK